MFRISYLSGLPRHHLSHAAGPGPRRMVPPRRASRPPALLSAPCRRRGGSPPPPGTAVAPRAEGRRAGGSPVPAPPPRCPGPPLRRGRAAAPLPVRPERRRGGKRRPRKPGAEGGRPAALWCRRAAGKGPRQQLRSRAGAPRRHARLPAGGGEAAAAGGRLHGLVTQEGPHRPG